MLIQSFKRVVIQYISNEKVRDYSLGCLLACTIVAAVIFWLMYGATTTDEVVHDAELQYASYSPKGEWGGSVVPASCESGIEHFPGDICGTPVPSYSCVTGHLGSQVDVSWPAVSGASSYAPRIQGLTQSQCASIGWTWFTDNFTCYVDGYNGLSLRLPLNRGQSHAFWVHADSPRSNHSPIYFTCPVLPPPTITGWSCVLGPAGERQMRVNWNRAAGYSAVYLRTSQNGVYPYALGTSENYVGDSVTFNIIPGNRYDFWMHTRDAQGSYSDAVGISNLVCNDPPPPVNPVSQCTYSEATDTFTAQISWNAPTGYNTFYTRVSTGGLYNWTPLATSSENFVGTTLTFPADRNVSSQTPRYTWWVHTKDTSNGWWSTDINQSFVCPLPAPRLPTSRSATCTATPWNPSNTAQFTMTARFAQWYDVEYENTASTTIAFTLNNVNSGHTASAVPWGPYRYRVRGENQDGGNPVQSGPWSSWENFQCLPPNPVITMSATPALVAKGARAGLVWQVQANYNMRCTVRGAGTNHSFDHVYDALNPASLTSSNASSPLQTNPLQNTTDFTISCLPQVPTYPDLPASDETVRVEVVPTLEEL